MILYYLKSAFRNLKSNGKFTLISITGFAFGISICLAIVLFIIKEYSYDTYHKNATEITRLFDATHNYSSIDYRVKDIVLENFPDVENACLVQQSNFPTDVQIKEKGYFVDGMMSVDNNFFEVFDIPFISGHSDQAFDNLNSVVLTESVAKNLFGTTHVLGRDLKIFNQIPLTVSGVIKDFPENSSISSDLLVNAENDEFKMEFSCENSEDKSTHRYTFRIYLQLNKNTNTTDLQAKLNQNIDLLKPYVEEAGLQPLSDIYLNDSTHGSQNKRGNLALMKLLASIAGIILVLAVINYINLTAAQQNKRKKDTGIRKTVGAFRENLLFHFLSESVIVALAALVFGILLVWLLLPVYQLIFDTNIEIGLLLNYPNSLFVVLTVLVVGVISGIGPAMFFSRISPIKVLSGTVVKQGRKGILRNSLTIFQFAISIVLIFCVTVIQRQIDFVKHSNPGFNEEQLLRVDVPWVSEADESKAMALVDELSKMPSIKSVSGSRGVPGQIRMRMGSNIEGSDKNIGVPSLIVDSKFLETFQLEIIKGRNLQPGDMGKVCMVNESFYKHFEFENLQKKRFENYGGYDIVGVVKDFHFNSLHKSIGPACIVFKKEAPQTINIRFAAGGLSAGMDAIQKTWAEFLPAYPIKYQFYDDWFDAMYKKEERFAKTIALFAMLAIVISCIGILGLAIFTAERRIKEIGIRKVNGAKVSEILSMLNKDFIKWVAIAFVVACPVAFYAMSKWLESFAYKTTLSWWIFALAGVLALGIALLTVCWQSWRAATRNPVEALRYE